MDICFQKYFKLLDLSQLYQIVSMFSRLNKRIFSAKGLTLASIAGAVFYTTYTYTRSQKLPQIAQENKQNIIEQLENNRKIQEAIKDELKGKQDGQIENKMENTGKEQQKQAKEDEKPIICDEKQQNVKDLQQQQQTLDNGKQNEMQGQKQQEKSESEEQRSPKRKEKNIIKGKLIYKQIIQIPEFSKEQLLAHQFTEDQFVLMIADLPYNRQFEEQIFAKVKNILRKRKSNQPLQIYRVDTKDHQVKEILSEKFSAAISEQTILILKHPYEKSLTSINFDMIIRSPQILPVILSDLAIIRNLNTLEKQLKSMSPHQTFLLFVVDSTSTDYEQILLSAKYIEMELEIQNMESIKLIVMDQSLANNSILNLKNPKVKSLHLIRKSNQFTYKAPNRFLFGGSPYHVIENISLFDKKRQMMIQKYLNKIETFSSMSIQSPFVCYITIDRNKISPKEERQILNTFSKLKNEQQFPHVSFIVKFAQVPYRGNEEEPFAHKRWSVMVANVEELTKQTYVHEIKSHQQTKKLGINQNNWQKKTHQYIYRDPELNEDSLKDFITNCVQGKQNFYYKTQKKMKMQKLNKITGQNFQQEILNDRSRSHWMFEYSDHCASCSVLSPIMQNFAEVVELFPDLKSRVHAVNCDRNRIKGQPYSPYTPNLYYYSRKWGNKWPLRYPLLDLIQDLGIKGMYDFSEITQSLGEVNYNNFDKHIKQVQKYKNLLEEL